MINRRDVSAADAVHVAGAPCTFGASRWNVGPAGARRELGRWLDLPEAQTTSEELYWNGTP